MSLLQSQLRPNVLVDAFESNGIIELLVVGRPKRMESSLEDHFASAKPPGSGKDIVHVHIF
jgi:hypothetical protein